MTQELKVALIGLDTSHTIEFARRMMAPDCRPELKVEGMRAIKCLRYPSIFQSEEAQDKRQQQLEAWGVPVTTDFDQAVAGSDALMLTINDPALHLDYVRRCAGLGRPLFIDKPLADSYAHGREIYELVCKHKARAFTASGMRFVPQVQGACAAMPRPRYTHVFGALGNGPAGYTPAQTLVWYGVHACELMEQAMGQGAVAVRTVMDQAGAVVMLEYPEGRRGVVEMTSQVWLYGGSLRDGERSTTFTVEVPYMVHNMPTDELRVIKAFFQGGPEPVAWDHALESMHLLDAARRSAESGKRETLSS
jgi:predicted dehydrogenase